MLFQSIEDSNVEVHGVPPSPWPTPCWEMYCGTSHNEKVFFKKMKRSYVKQKEQKCCSFFFHLKTQIFSRVPFSFFFFSIAHANARILQFVRARIEIYPHQQALFDRLLHSCSPQPSMPTWPLISSITIISCSTYWISQYIFRAKASGALKY